MKRFKTVQQTLTAAAATVLLYLTFALADHKPNHNPGGGREDPVWSKNSAERLFPCFFPKLIGDDPSDFPIQPLDSGPNCRQPACKPNGPATAESQRVLNSKPDHPAEPTWPGALFAKVRAQAGIG